MPGAIPIVRMRYLSKRQLWRASLRQGTHFYRAYGATAAEAQAVLQRGMQDTLALFDMFEEYVLQEEPS